MAQLLDIRLNEPEQTERATPVAVLDQALSLLRSARAAHWLRGIAASVPLAAVLIGLYVLERVVGARPSLPLFAALCVLAYWARFQLLSGLAGELVASLSPRAAVSARPRPRPRRLLATLETALVAGIGSCAWAACLIVAGQRSFFGMLACLPLLSVRGAIAPSLLARAACAPEAGTAALALALADTRALRHVFVRVELLALLGLLVLFGNLYALLATALLVASSVLGLDVGFVSALIAPDNELLLLLLLGLATLLLEPLRAAISARALHMARERSEAADLRAAIDALPSTAPERRARTQPTAAGRGLAVLLLLTSGSLAADARAEASAGDAEHPRSRVPRGLEREPGAVDDLARNKAQAILARGEFLPSAADSQRGAVEAWLDQRLRERERELADHDLSTPPRFELRLPPLLVMLVALVLMLAVGVWLVRGLRSARVEARAARSRRASLAPTQAKQLAEAARLAREGAYAQALRQLYAACLQRLVRAQPASVRATQTNGQLLQRVSPGPLRAAFERLTAQFERCSYGRQPVSQAEYEAARALCAQLLQDAERTP